MPKKTFMNLNDEKKQEIEHILLSVFHQRPVSQVTVSEIIEAMGMSRGAFYKYFCDLDDAFTYIVLKQSSHIHQDIFRFIAQNENNYFKGIEAYLSWVSLMDRTTDHWKGIFLFVLNNHLIKNKRNTLTKESPFLQQWLKLLESNHFKIEEVKEALSFLYFSMDMVVTSLADFIINDWTQEELLQDFSYKVDWLKKGMIKGEDGYQ